MSSLTISSQISVVRDEDQSKKYTSRTIVKGVAFGFYYSRTHIWNSYIIVTAGILLIMMVLYGFNILLSDIFKIRFPASVLGMLVNLVLLCGLSVLSNLGSKEEKGKNWKSSFGEWCGWLLTNYLTLVKPSMNFTLKWINIFFIPSFIILPLSSHITFIECLKIAGVFVGGFVLLFLVNVYLIAYLKWVYRSIGFHTGDEPASMVKEEQNNNEIEMKSIKSGDGNAVFTSMRDDITTIDLTSLRLVKTEIPTEGNSQLYLNENPFDTQESSIRREVSALSAPEIQQPEPIYHRDSMPTSSFREEFNTGFDTANVTPESNRSGTNSSLSTNSSTSNRVSTPNEESPMEKFSEEEQNVILFVTKYIDWIVYASLFLISLPFYYISSIHIFLPYHLGLTICSYYIALLIPQKWPQSKKFAHPILVSTFEILFVCFIGSLIFHKGKPKGFLDDLEYYKTGKNYLTIFSGKTLRNNGQYDTLNPDDYTATPKWPGCGDFLSSLMDVSIVSLALPMFSYRRDFVKNFWVLMPTILVSVAMTFLIYPIFCYHIGIESGRSIGFIGRSVTLALGTPLINSLDGSVSLMAVCTILSGICGVLIGDHAFSLLRVPKGDYLTRGVTLGINCGAIATAHLLNVDPRAASMSSLSFSMFGTIMIIMASIGVIADTIKSWAGL